MADTPTANRWTFFTSLTPTINAVVTAAIWVAIGAGGMAGYQAYNPAFKPPVMLAADPPKAVASSLASSPSPASDTRLEAIEAQLAALLARLPEKPADVTKAKGGRKAKAKPQTLMGEIGKLDPLGK